jgi:hypothetical protein
LARDRQGDRLERIIGQRLAAGREAGAAQCLDASIIAAYRERLLSRDERAECERHFAQCVRCGSALAALARIDETDAIEAVAHGGATSAEATRSDRRAWWRLRGPLPIAAFGAAAAIVIVIAIRTFSTPRGPIEGEARSELQAKLLAANAAPTASKPTSGALGSNALSGSNSLLAMNQPTQAQPASPPPLQKSYAASAPQPLSATESFAQRRVAPPPQPEPRAREQARSASRDELKDKKSRASELDKLSREVASAPTAPAAAPAPPPPLMISDATSTGAPATSRETAAAPPNGAGVHGAPDLAAAAPTAQAAPASAAPSIPTAGLPVTVGGFGTSTAPAAAPANAGATAGAVAAGSGAASSALSYMAAAVVGPMPGANAIVVEPPDHTAVWMVGAHGAISRYSRATGWVPETSGVTADLTGGSAPSSATCWVVGRAGTILRTVDGQHWTTVVAPVNDDLTSVVASSASDATIFAAGGRRFATSDGGASWRPVQ